MSGGYFDYNQYRINDIESMREQFRHAKTILDNDINPDLVDVK